GNSINTITAIPEPSTYVAALGLLALMLWPPPPPAREGFLSRKAWLRPEGSLECARMTALFLLFFILAALGG
ncbi:MAG: hypothetical protein WCQ57_12970, partial [Verrucomicrobiota bacterium]